MLIFLYFENLYFFCIFELLENMCHTTRAVGQTLKGKENHFLNYLGESVTRHERPDRHNTSERKLFLIFFYILIFIIFKYFFVFLEKKLKMRNLFKKG